MSEKNYYNILGVKKDASVDEIKKAFRRQAVKHHPDQGGDEVKFKEINEAYEVLSNPDKRQRYDQFGQAGLGGQAGFNQAGFDPDQGVSFNFGEGGLGDIFSFFGGMGRSQAPKSGRDIEVVIELDFKEAVFGIEKEISLSINDICHRCHGQRAEPNTKVETCETCRGSGQRVRIMKTMLGNIQQAVTCSDCQGIGSDIKTPCRDCQGQGVSQQNKVVNLLIPAGIEDGATIRLRGQGEKNRQGVAGDLYAVITVRPDKHFTREGDLILSEQVIDMIQAALGDTIEVQTIDDEAIKLKIPAGTQSGTDFKLENRGVPHLRGKGRGSHIVQIIVEIPKKLNSQQKQLLKDFKNV